MSGMAELVRIAARANWPDYDDCTGQTQDAMRASIEPVVDAIAAHLAEADDDLRAKVARVEALRDEWAGEDHPTSTVIARELDEALTGHRALSGGAEAADGGRVAAGEGGDVCGAQTGCEHEWTKRGDEGDPWSQCWLCGEVRNGHMSDEREVRG